MQIERASLCRTTPVPSWSRLTSFRKRNRLGASEPSAMHDMAYGGDVEFKLDRSFGLAPSQNADRVKDVASFFKVTRELASVAHREAPSNALEGSFRA